MQKSESGTSSSLLYNKMAAAATNHFLILYASQTGNAKSIAEGLHEEASKKSLNTSVHCVNEFEKEKVSISLQASAVYLSARIGSCVLGLKVKQGDHSLDVSKYESSESASIFHNLNDN